MTERPTNAWLSVSAYARVWGVSRRTVYKWLDEGLLDSYTAPPSVIRIKNTPPGPPLPRRATSVRASDSRRLVDSGPLTSDSLTSSPRPFSRPSPAA